MNARFFMCLVFLLSLLAAPSFAQDYKTTFVPLGHGEPGVLYEQLKPGPKAAIAVFAMHDDGDYLTPGPTNVCMQIAQRGYTALCANTYASRIPGATDFDEDRFLLNVKAGVEFLRGHAGVSKVVLFGHSGGGGMMSAYQNVAENGVKACQGPEKLIKCSDSLADMPPADGVMLIDSSLGFPGSLMMSIDPAVADESGGRVLDPGLDMYNPANGYNPKGTTYSNEFKARYFAAQSERMNKLIAEAEDRLVKINAGEGLYKDDEPFTIPGGSPAPNKLLSQDVSLMEHTHNAWPLLHANGKVTVEVIHTVRVPEGGTTPTALLTGAAKTTVKRFLSSFAVRTTPDFGYTGSELRGIDYKSSYAITLNSVEGITKPLLQMGMTGSHEYFFAEFVREHAKSTDKTLAYVEGAVHGFTPCTKCAVARGLPPDYYGDTVKTLFDYIDGWLNKPGRFQ